jgi:hypothetical protein
LAREETVVQGLQTATSVLFLICAAAAVSGVFRNRRYRACWSFAAYLVAVLACEAAVVLWPQRFFHWWFFITKQSAYDILKVGVALELAHHAFLVFPGARLAGRRVVFAVLAASTALIAWTSLHGRTWTDWQPAVVSATIWLFASTAAVVLWYRLPLHAWHRAILLGLTPYQLVFVTLLSVLQKWGAREAYATLGLLDSIAFLVMTAWWAVAAWRPYQEPPMSAGMARRLGLDRAA